MKLLIAVMLGVLIGAGCRYFDLPVPSPPTIVGALLVVAITMGYWGTDQLLSRRATNAGFSAGPTGAPATLVEPPKE